PGLFLSAGPRTEYRVLGTQYPPEDPAMSRPTRRTFAASAVALPALTYARALGANDRVRLGFVGVGNRGDQLLDAFLVHKDCSVDALCDAYRPYLDAAAEKVSAAKGHPSKATFNTADYR